MEITSYETAKRLKEAGFPQPEFETWQFWYNQEGDLKFIGKNSVTHGHFESHCIESGMSVRAYPITMAVFYAPTATDILRELGSDYSICCFGAYKIQWEIERHMPELFNILPFTWIHENPAEAAALAWLDKNKNN